MVRQIRWALGALGALVLLGGGASIFWQPADEIVYGRSGPAGTCGSRGCVAIYLLEVGNTGSGVQPEVRLRLRGAVLDTAPFPPRVEDFGKVERPVEVSRDGDAVIYSLGAVKPDGRVQLSLVLERPTRDALPAWDDLLVAVEPARGRALRGSPGWVILLRLWYGLARAF